MNRRLYFSVLLLSVLWCSLLMGFSWLLHSGYFRLAASVSLICSIICHQDPARSFRVCGVTLPVCSRCTTVYLGSLVGITLFPLMRHIEFLSRRLNYLLVISTIPVGLDVAINLLGIWNNTFLSRSISGGFLGLTCSTAFLILIHKAPFLE
jgi:uncharacterized membrane protein